MAGEREELLNYLNASITANLPRNEHLSFVEKTEGRQASRQQDKFTPNAATQEKLSLTLNPE